MTAPVGDAGLGPTTTPQVTEGTPGNGSAQGVGNVGETTQSDASSTKQFSAEYVEKLRREAAAHRVSAAEALKQSAELSEQLKKYQEFMPQQVDDLTKQVETLTTVAQKTAVDAQDANLRYAVAVAAQQLGIVDPDAAVQLMDRQAIVWDGGIPGNVTELLTTLLERKPYLKAQPSLPIVPNTGPTNPGAGTRPSAALTLDDVKKMSAAEINARWAEVSAVLAGRK